MSENHERLPERWLSMELFTDYHRVVGQIMTAELRTNGVLNSTDPQLLLQKVTTAHLLRSNEEALATGFARVAKDSIILAVPDDEHETERLERAARIYNRGELLQQRMVIVLGNYEVTGNLHLPPDQSLHEALLYRSEAFVGMTEVSVIFLPAPATRFTANSILINRNRLNFLCAGAP